MRLQTAVLSFFLISAGYLIYGWTTEKQVGMYASLVGLFICKFDMIYLLIVNFDS